MGNRVSSDDTNAQGPLPEKFSYISSDNGTTNPAFTSPSGQQVPTVYTVPADGFPTTGGVHHMISSHSPGLPANTDPSAQEQQRTKGAPFGSIRDDDLAPEESFLLGRIVSREIDDKASDNILVAEVAPSNSGIFEDRSSVGDDGKWRMSLSRFTSKKQGPDYKQWNKRIRSYYKAQDELIESFEELQMEIADAMATTADAELLRKRALFYARLTFAINFMLLIAKAVASVLSGSISIISSLVDSVVDLLSGVIIWWASRAVKKRDPYVYPQGRTKLEPVAIIILSVIMAAASLQLIRESISKITGLTSSDNVTEIAHLSSKLPIFEIPTVVIAGSTVVIKLLLWLACRRISSPTVQALAMDHRNDVCSNAVALACGYIGSREMFVKTGIFELGFVDPGGAILISLYIIYNWWQTGSEQIRYLTGYTAHPEFLSKITWICVNHHKKIRQIDTVRAFHFGNNFLVEVDIVLPETMSMKIAHDIGESLQLKLEALPEVERAFVHLDYEFTHHPKSEHKVV